MAEKLVAWLIDQGWEVYQEVQISAWGGIADIVAVKREPERIAWIIEVKTSCGYQLSRQAWDRKKYSPHVSVAVPYPKRYTKMRKEFITLMEKEGIGFIHIYDNGAVTIVKEPDATKGSRVSRYRQDSYERLFNLAEEYKTFCPAGSARGGYLTAYKMTCMNVADYVREHPGCSIREAIQNIDHHYSSDKSAISTLSQRAIPGVEQRWCLFVKEEP